MLRLATLVIALVVALGLAGTASAAHTVRVPRDAADWATFSPAERNAAIAYEWQRYQQSLKTGQVTRTVVSAHVTLPAGDQPALGSALTAESALATATATGTCQLTFDNVSSGTWTRAGGWTDASGTVYYIYASRVGLQGQLLRDGALKGNWYQEKYNSDWAENWSGWDWKYWFEHPNYTSKGWFGARQTNGGTWILGPDKPCSVSGTP